MNYLYVFQKKKFISFGCLDNEGFFFIYKDVNFVRF